MDSESVLVEREDPLAELHSALERVRDRRGELALVAGEAGAGKTSVIREFVARLGGGQVVLLGSCDPLSAPRPFGPLIDAAHAIDPEVATRMGAGASRAEVFATALSFVDGSRCDGGATVFVIEDAHWADDATLDLITFRTPVKPRVFDCRGAA